MAKRTKRTGGYRGELRRPIYLSDSHQGQRRFDPRGVLLLDSKTQAREAATIEQAEVEKQPALFAHFSIEEDDQDRWQLLALALARKHVRGFQVVRGTGAPVVESVDLLCRIYRYYIWTKAGRRHRSRSRTVTDAEICKALSNDKDFKSAFPELKSPRQKRLQNLVTNAKKLRRARIADNLKRCAYKRRLGPEESADDTPFGDRPPWISDGPSTWFLKLDKSGPPRRRE